MNVESTLPSGDSAANKESYCSKNYKYPKCFQNSGPSLKLFEQQ